MSISGGIKFFTKSACKLADGAQAIASSGVSSANFAIDRNSDTKWVTSGSNDTLTETLSISFSGTQTFNRLLLTDFNFKQFTIQYDVSGVWTDFTNTVGIDGATSMGKISETVFSDDSAYYEFDTVMSSKLLITVTKTQIANQDKFLNLLTVTTEIGTLQGHPGIKATVDKNERKKPALSGRMMIIKSIETFSVILNFKNYPGRSPYGNDFDIMFRLFDLDDNFLVWLCGGRRGSGYFSYQARPFRLRDIYECNVSDKITPIYSNEIFSTSVNMQVTISEAI